MISILILVASVNYLQIYYLITIFSTKHIYLMSKILYFMFDNIFGVLNLEVFFDGKPETNGQFQYCRRSVRRLHQALEKSNKKSNKKFNIKIS